MKPRDPDRVTDPVVVDARTAGDHPAGRFVAGDERRLGFDRPVAVGRVKVGVTDAACRDLDEQFAGAGERDGAFFDRERLAELAHDCRLHGCRDTGAVAAP